jgi:membrane peptidoglycan carboxypeptidase
MDAAAAAMTLDVLRDPAARRQGFGDDLVALAPGVTFALKTGTSSNWRDAWAAVSSSRFTVVLWLGDPASAPMAQVSGFEAAAPTAVRVLAAAERLAPEVPPVRVAVGDGVGRALRRLGASRRPCVFARGGGAGAERSGTADTVYRARRRGSRDALRRATPGGWRGTGPRATRSPTTPSGRAPWR